MYKSFPFPINYYVCNVPIDGDKTFVKIGTFYQNIWICQIKDNTYWDFEADAQRSGHIRSTRREFEKVLW